MKKKKIIKFQGGLGNQMFQYALGKAIKEKTNYEVIFDASWFEKSQKKSQKKGLGIRYYEMNTFKNADIQFANNFQIFAAKFLNFIGLYKKYKELNAFNYDENIFTNEKYNYLSGYFQNEKYFKSFKEQLQFDFELPQTEEDDEYNKNLLEKIKNSNNPVFIHVRREDYVNLGYTISLEYYKKAVQYIKEHVENPTFFVFSAGDIDYIKNEFDIGCEFHIAGNGNSSKDNFWKDMRLMASCSHGIIANSTYSWWAAWLCKNENKIITAPSPWLNGDDRIICDNWVKIKI